MSAIQSINPATGAVIQEYTPHTPSQIQESIALAGRGFQAWSALPVEARCNHLRRLADVLDQHKEEYARLATAEMGKPIRQSRDELDKCARTLRYYADEGATMLRDKPIPSDTETRFITYRPLGVVLAIMPWNFPYWQAIRALGPILLGGNAMLLKHASNVSGCALALQDAAREAGLPDGVFQTLLMSGGDAEKLIADPGIAAVTFTGSTGVGKKIAAAAGSVIKKQVLELGGSDAYLILEDADLDLAAKVCTEARLTNTGQSCLAAKRFIVVESVAETFTAKFLQVMQGKTFSDPMEDNCALGPIARHDLRDELHEQVKDSITQGARLLCGGEVPDNAGAYYPPTILADVQPGMRAFDEEMFGPVAAVINAKDEADAIRLANASIYGLGGAVFTQDVARGTRIAREELACGNAFVNLQVHSDPRMPFGGIKESGYGRELAAFGLREFVNVKSVVAGK